MQKSRFVARTFKAVVTAIFAGFTLVMAGAAGPVQAQNSLTIVTDWAPFGAHGPLFLAAQKGWFKDAGLDVTIQDGKGSSSSLQLLGAGKVDVAFVQLSTMAAAIDKGLPVISIAGFVRSGDNGIMVPNDSPIKSAKDFAGKRIVYPSGSSSASLMEAYFRVAGIPRDKVNLIGVDSSALASTYVAGGVDGAVTTVAYLEPMISDKRPSRGIYFADGGLAVPGFGLVALKADETAKADALKKFVAANQRAWKYVADGHVDEAIDAIVAQRPSERLDRGVMTAQLKAYLALTDTQATKGTTPGWQDEGDWAKAIKALEDAGIVKPGSTPKTYYTNQFAAK
jgi:NitT/TauT family transport system substrate-binding protein